MKDSLTNKPHFGALSVVALLLFGSAFIRVALGATTAMASTDSDTETPKPVIEQPAPVSVEQLENELIAKLKNRIAELDAREQELMEKDKILKILKADIDAQLAKLKRVEETLQKTMHQANQAADQDLNQLVLMYENMKPKRAAAMFQSMQPEFAAGFIFRMSPETAANLMSELPPESAYAISAILASRHVDTPTEQKLQNK